MSVRSNRYQDMLAACRDQPTGWLERCAAEPSEGMMRVPVVRLALRTVLRERHTSMPADVGQITEYGITAKLQRSIRVF